jgi:hypothetical protein
MVRVAVVVVVVEGWCVVAMFGVVAVERWYVVEMFGVVAVEGEY